MTGLFCVLRLQSLQGGEGAKVAKPTHLFNHPYEETPGEGLLATRILLYPDSYKIGQIEPVLAATAAASNYAMKTV